MNTERSLPTARRPEPEIAEPHSVNPARRPSTVSPAAHPIVSRAVGTRAMALVGFAVPVLGAAEPTPMFG